MKVANVDRGSRSLWQAVGQSVTCESDYTGLILKFRQCNCCSPCFAEYGLSFMFMAVVMKIETQKEHENGNEDFD